MALIDRIAATFNRLQPDGWGELLGAAGLVLPAGIVPADLEKALLKPFAVKRNVPGFADFAADGNRGIEPGIPSRSLLYHAFASPLVTKRVDGSPLSSFPTLAEIETVEDYVFAARRWSLADVEAYAATLAKTPKLAIVVFATEYRPAPDTVHRSHADICFSRCGVARVGNREAFLDRSLRGFLNHAPNDDAFAIRVCPARYSVWLACQAPGDPASFGPLDANAMKTQARRYASNPQAANLFPPELPDDRTLPFWVPLHKIFAGTESLTNRHLQVILKAHHVNEKLARLFQFPNIGDRTEEELRAPPFRVTEGLADFALNAEWGQGWLMPPPRAAMVAPAFDDGRRLTLNVPPVDDPKAPRQFFALRSSQQYGVRGSYRVAPGYAHIRHALQDGEFVDLNAKYPNPQDLLSVVTAGNYDALVYSDFTADGWIEADVPELANDVPLRRSAYSLIAAPDFFPRVDQRSLIELQDQLTQDWFVPPLALSDSRVAANVQLRGSGFEFSDVTATAIVSMPGAHAAGGPFPSPGLARHTALPDDAAGVFQPGWDVGLVFDRARHAEHLANYTLGLPFPEDVKLCAAISSYWPGTVPDAARVFPPIVPDNGHLIVAPQLPTVIPMTDAEIGMTGAAAWDGSVPPSIGADQTGPFVDFSSPYHADYIQRALDNRFSVAMTEKMDLPHYKARVLAMDCVYRTLPAAPPMPPGTDARALWLVVSFTDALAADVAAAAKAAKAAAANGPTFRFVLMRPGTVEARQAAPVIFRVRPADGVFHEFIVSSGWILEKANGAWQLRTPRPVNG